MMWSRAALRTCRRPVQLSYRWNKGSSFLEWVPEAYRSSTKGNNNSNSYKNNNRGPTGRQKKPYAASRQSSRKRDDIPQLSFRERRQQDRDRRRLENKQRKYEGLVKGVRRLVRRYRHLIGAPETKEDWQEALLSAHVDSGDFCSLKKIHESDDTLKALCRVLQDLASRDERALASLVEVRKDRGILIETLQNNLKQSNRDVNPVQLLVSYFTGITPTEEESLSMDDIVLAHQDTSLGVTPAVFRRIIDDLLENSEDETNVTALPARMLRLLDMTPPDFVPDHQTMQTILENLAKTESLENAQRARDLGRKRPLGPVLVAYRNASAKKPRREAAKQVAELFLAETEADTASRIDCSVVLQCLINTFPSNADDWWLDTATSVVRHTLSDPEYESLVNLTEGNIDGELPEPETHPILNQLAHLYALTATGPNITIASRYVDFLVESSVDSAYPWRETFDGFFKGVTMHLKGSLKKVVNEKDRLAFLDHCTSLLLYMYSHQNLSCRPRGETFEWILLLLRTIEPPDMEKRALELLEMLEIREAVVGRIATLKHYHHILACLTSPTKALNLITQLEIRTIPLLLNDRELKKLRFELYKLELRPSKKTYRMVLDICFEQTNDDKVEEAVTVASEIYKKMMNRGHTPDTTKRALELAGKLPVDNKLRKDFELLVLSSIDEGEEEDVA